MPPARTPDTQPGSTAGPTQQRDRRPARGTRPAGQFGHTSPAEPCPTNGSRTRLPAEAWHRLPGGGMMAFGVMANRMTTSEQPKANRA